MRRNHIIKHTCIAWSLILGLASCGDESLQDAHSLDAKSTPMTFMVSHPGKKITPKNTRATETDFEKNDKIGLFVAKADSPLEIGGNLVNNAALTYDGGKWTPAHTLYWDEGLHTNLPGDLLAEDLRLTLHHLSDITGGQITPQETLNNIFSHFCIGK